MWESKLKNKDKFELRVAQVPNSYNGKQSYKYHTSESAYVSTSDKDAKQKKTLPVVVKPSAKLKTLITDTLDEGLEIEKGTTGISINGTKAGLNTTVKTNGLSGVDKTNLKNYVVQYELVNTSTSYKTSFMKFNEKVSEADLKVITTMLKNVKSSSKLKMAIYDTRTATNKQKPLIIHEGKYYTDGLDLIASKSAEAYIDTLSVEDYNKLLGIEDFSNDHTKKNKRLDFLWDNYYSLFQ